MQHLVSSHL